MTIKNSAILAAFTLFTLVAGPAFAAGEARPAAAATQIVDSSSTEAPRATAGAPLDAEAARYAKRDAKAAKQKDYKGGDYLVLGISTGAAIVILVIVLLLI